MPLEPELEGLRLGQLLLTEKHCWLCRDQQLMYALNVILYS